MNDVGEMQQVETSDGMVWVFPELFGGDKPGFDPGLARNLDWTRPPDPEAGVVMVKLMVEASAAPFPDISIYPALGKDITVSGPGRAATATLLSVEVSDADAHRTSVVLGCDRATARLLEQWRLGPHIFGFEFFPAPGLLCLPVSVDAAAPARR